MHRLLKNAAMCVIGNLFPMKIFEQPQNNFEQSEWATEYSQKFLV